MNDKKYLKMAIELSKLCIKKGILPVRAIVVHKKYVISGNLLNRHFYTPVNHGEINAISEACKTLKLRDLHDSTLYVPLEPCLMCFSFANWIGIDKIVYGCKKTDEMVNKGYYEGKTNLFEVNRCNNRRLDLIYIPNYETIILEMIKASELNN